MRLPILAAILALFAFASACSRTEEAPAAEAVVNEAVTAEAVIAEEPAAPSEAEGGSETGRVFGEAPAADRILTPLAAIAADPESFEGQTVKTTGEISQVCQRMGCWMELSSEGVDPIMVPMAGHSFFLPRDVTGRDAVIEGQVALRERSANEIAHLESEGATATGRAVQITATGVAIR